MLIVRRPRGSHAKPRPITRYSEREREKKNGVQQKNFVSKRPILWLLNGNLPKNNKKKRMNKYINTDGNKITLSSWKRKIFLFFWCSTSASFSSPQTISFPFFFRINLKNFKSLIENWYLVITGGIKTVRFFFFYGINKMSSRFSIIKSDGDFSWFSFLVLLRAAVFLKFITPEIWDFFSFKNQ